MGIYLATPNKEKNTVTETSGKMVYAATGMQGNKEKYSISL